MDEGLAKLLQVRVTSPLQCLPRELEPRAFFTGVRTQGDKVRVAASVSPTHLPLILAGQGCGEMTGKDSLFPDITYKSPEIGCEETQMPIRW